jgi:hypothetical protein
MDGVRIIFRNFIGKPTPFNAEGDRNFGVILSPEIAEQLAADGWNVKVLQPRPEHEEEVEPQPWLPCFLKYHGRNGPVRPPLVVLVTDDGRKRNNLGEDDVEQLDWANIVNVDLIVRPYPWEFNNKTGIKALVKTMFVTIEEDELERKYSDMDEK